jgi:hypothetical protein
MLENGVKLTDTQLLKLSLGMLNDVICHTMEIHTDEGIALTHFLHSAYRYGTAVFIGQTDRLKTLEDGE